MTTNAPPIVLPMNLASFDFALTVTFVGTAQATPTKSTIRIAVHSSLRMLFLLSSETRSLIVPKGKEEMN